MGRSEGLLGLVLFGLGRLENQPTSHAWAIRQARWPVEAWPSGTRAIRARALSGRAGPLLIFIDNAISWQKKMTSHTQQGVD